MTCTSSSFEYLSSRRSSSLSSSIVQSSSSSSETTDIISQNELKIQKLLLELQDDLKKVKDCYNNSRDTWLSIQQQSLISSGENTHSRISKNNVMQAINNVHDEMQMYRIALEKIAQVRQLQIEINNATKNHNDSNRNHTTRRGLADLLSHMAFTLTIWYGNDHDGNRVSLRIDQL